ncbi:chaperone protein EcpD [Rosenbergiella nectarea]|uniref:Chaperone protein EcpD n=1 Tax=Rosenbergiella nectarea TaxID=988801 RepID=A0A1H9IQ53_9GAMM|nr:fimbria/pilus periplasmic chaperone [Rosenbergiella nectarea]SEQ76891.1 chaperone protein EcpD [Rosenbergiella nectarea]
MRQAIRISVKGLALIFLVTSGLWSHCYAGVTLTGTRIVFLEGQQEKIVRTSNKGERPALVQVWVDEGQSTVEGTELETPFMAIPPLFRMEPGKGQSIRVRYLGQDLPTDRESVFWFNLLEIPPDGGGEAPSERLSLAFKTRIKLFYRPASLTESSADQGAKIQWKLGQNGELVVANPTPYYLSFYSVGLSAGGRTQELALSMLKPFSEQKIILPSAVRNKIFNKINFELINDYGNGIQYQGQYREGKGFTVSKK